MRPLLLLPDARPRCAAYSRHRDVARCLGGRGPADEPRPVPAGESRADHGQRALRRGRRRGVHRPGWRTPDLLCVPSADHLRVPVPCRGRCRPAETKRCRRPEGGATRHTGAAVEGWLALPGWVPARLPTCPPAGPPARRLAQPQGASSPPATLAMVCDPIGSPTITTTTTTSPNSRLTRSATRSVGRRDVVHRLRGQPVQCDGRRRRRLGHGLALAAGAAGDHAARGRAAADGATHRHAHDRHRAGCRWLLHHGRDRPRDGRDVGQQSRRRQRLPPHQRPQHAALHHRLEVPPRQGALPFAPRLAPRALRPTHLTAAARPHRATLGSSSRQRASASPPSSRASRSRSPLRSPFGRPACYPA